MEQKTGIVPITMILNLIWHIRKKVYLLKIIKIFCK